MTDLVILGASARAAAFSALRAGFSPWCADLFADRDLAARCPVVRVSGRDYPHGFLRILQDSPQAPIVYTGGLESHPELVDAVGEERPLWGNGGSVLRRARDPLSLRQALAASGLPAPEVRLSPDGLPMDGSWLRKPMRGSGGSGIEPWMGQGRARKPVYFQQYIEGESCAAVYVADGAGARLLGVTRQLVGPLTPGSSPQRGEGSKRRASEGMSFRYCGSVGPLPLSPGTREIFERMGNVLTAAFGLRGIFGVDAVLRDGSPWCVEVNPRYTASVEVLEFALGVPAMGQHAGTFRAGSVSDGGPVRGRWSAHTHGTSSRGTPILGKAILFASANLVLPELPSLTLPAPQEIPQFADIPAPGTAIQRGWPILTLFHEAETVDACTEALRQKAVALDRLLFPR
jgi:predicted ATP-grasp superfamily ATP-dependent carboligase